MGLTVFHTSDERRVGAGVEQLLREALARAKGSNALVLAPSLSVSLEVQRALDQAGGLAMGVDCATINTWCELRWALYGDGRTLVKHPMRAVLMELVLAQASREGALAPLDAGAGTVQLLCEAAQRGLPWMPKHATDALTAGESRAVELLERYGRVLERRGLVEPAEAAAKLPALMAEEGVALPPCVLIGFGELSRATREFALAYATAGECALFCQAPEGPAGDVARAAAERLIPATLELGGKSANIIVPDAKWDMVLDGVQLGILFNQGQVCCAGSRVFVQEGIYDKFVEAAVKAFNNVNVGDPLDPNTQMGAQVDQGQLRKIMSYVNLAKEEGATIACGGEPYTDGACANGSFMKPTLIVNATNDMRVAQEEIFGPVAVVIKFKTEEEVIAMANDSVYGLGGAVWTRDINRAIRVARGVETGRMWVNTYNQIPSGAPFGGYKQSGIGRETHKVILEHYTQQKNIMINLNETPSGFYPEK